MAAERDKENNVVSDIRPTVGNVCVCFSLKFHACVISVLSSSTTFISDNKDRAKAIVNSS